jgi:hypothetical protein
LTLGATNTFAGNILASESITLGGGTLNGRALAINGAVSISSAETIDLNPGATIPEPETAGNILVYKTSTTATVFDFNAQTTRRETMKGYLVLDVNLTSQKVLAAQHVTYSGTTQQTEVVDVVFHDDVPGYIVLEYSGDNYDAVLYGKDPNTDIGLGLTHKKPVAKSLRGHLLGSNDSGSGIMNATLDTVWTKAANKNEDPITTVVDDIVNYLVGKKFYYPSFIQTQINEAIAERNGDEPVTVTIGAGTYNEDLVIDEPNVTLKSARGKATTIITPGAAGQGVIEISGDNVTIDGFTIRHGTQASSVASPQEHTIWVHANNSTIKNCTIIGAGGNQACIFIGGRNGASGKAIYRYNATAGTTEGHTIQNNTFRYGTATTGSGEGWGIFAVKLTDDCLIKGNTFKGDAADVGHWNTNEGAPGTGIVIHSAAKGSGTNAVIIEDNTAQYVKYSWLTFNASYPYNDNLILGNFYEQPEDSTVEDVIVRDNTAHDLGKDALNKSGVAITFTGQDKDDSLTPANADLTIGAGGVTIRNNALYNNACGVYIAEPGSWDDITYGCVITANNITINPDNSIYGNITDGPDSGYGVYNGTIEDNQDGGAVNVDAGNNWWGAATGPYDVNNTSGAGNQVSTGVDYTPYRTTAP